MSSSACAPSAIYLIDPHQVRVLHTLGSANSFLRRWPDVHETWTSVWHHRAGSGVQGRFGLGAQVQRACSLLGIQWSEPFKLEWNNGTLSLLSSDRTHFLDTLRSLARVTVLARAAKRPCLKGLGPGVDFVATRAFFLLKDVSQYDKGVLRSILCNGVLTQHALFKQGRADSGLCPFCKRAAESLFHFFWICPRWDSVRSQFTLPSVSVIQGWEAYANLCGIFPVPDCRQTVISRLSAEEFSLPRLALPEGESILDVWVDGSVIHRHDPRLARAGAGVFFASDSPFNFGFGILGPVQSVERAESRSSLPSAPLRVLQYGLCTSALIASMLWTESNLASLRAIFGSLTTGCG